MTPHARRPPRWLAPAVALLLSAAPAAAQEAELLAEGTLVFRWILSEHQLRPLKQVSQLHEEPAKTVLVVLGDLGALENVERFGSLRRFVEQGGAVLIASDRPSPPALARLFGVRVTGQLVEAPAPGQHYEKGPEKNWPACPFAYGLAADGAPPVFEKLTRVATNRPSYLESAGRDGPAGGLRRLGVLPDLCVTRPPGGLPRDITQPLFAVGGEMGEGRVLILADHSLFINSMMFQKDNENIEFADNCVRWLTGPGQRDRLLFLEDGAVRTDFVKDVPEQGFLNQLLRDLEQRRFFDRLLISLFGMSGILKGLAVALTVALLAFGFHRLTQARHRVEPGLPLFATAVARLAPAGPVIDQRHQALFENGNLWEPARTLARHVFEDALGPLGTPGPTPPAAEAAGGWWHRRAMRRNVQRLWRLAYGTPPVSVSPREFADVVAQANAVKAALDEGTLALTVYSVRA
jgi:hypothetical protein